MKNGYLRVVRCCLAVFLSVGGTGLAQQTATTKDSHDIGRWVEVTPMQVRRAEHGLVTLRDGRVLAVGGHTSNDPRTNRTSEVYDPETESWEHLSDLMEPRMESERPRRLPTGEVMLSGGHGGVCCDALTQVDLFNPESLLWGSTAPMNHRRGEHAVVVLESGDVLVAGGFDWGTETAPHPAELYSLQSMSWSVVDDFPEPGLVNIAVPLTDGSALVKGDKYSKRCFLFDPKTMEFTETGSLIEPRLRPTFTILQDGRVLAAGGRVETEVISSVEIYDPASRKWTKTESMRDARIRHSATLLGDGTVLVVGGRDDATAHNSAEVYDPRTET